MIRFFSLVSFWTFTSVLTSLSFSANLTEADPTDDFSLSLNVPKHSHVYRLMSARRVEQIFRDRLDPLPPLQTVRLAQHLLALCKNLRLNPAFVLALIDVESSFQIQARSSQDAFGLMQIQIPTAQFVVDDIALTLSGHESFAREQIFRKPVTSTQLKDPFFNLLIGTHYLAWLRNHYDIHSPYYALAAYNVGPARLDALLAKRSFRPKESKRYFQNILKRVPEFRYYRKQSPKTKLPKTPPPLGASQNV